MAELMSIIRTNPLTSTLFGIVMTTAAKGFIVFLLTSLVILAVRRLSANQKHIIWFLIIVSISWLILPSLNLNIPVPAEQSEALRVVTTPLMSRDEYIEQIVLSDDVSRRCVLFSTYGLSLHTLPWPLIILLVWISGFLVFFLRFIIGRIAVTRLVRTAKEYTSRRDSCETV
jgi:beta-lactamase regulating signal transducer with metallopeptidase domain